MNFLELCQQAVRDTGTSNTVNTVTPTQEEEEEGYEGITVVGLVRDAWREIQQLHEEWTFMRKSFEFTLTVGQYEYQWDRLVNASGQRIIPTFRHWLTDGLWYLKSPSSTPQPEFTPLPALGPLANITWQQFRARFTQFAYANQQPTWYTIAPDRRIMVGPPPNESYRVSGEYQRGVQLLKQNTDVPEGLPEEYHPAITWKTVMLLNGFDEAGEGYRWAEIQYKTILSSLKRTHLPEITYAPALV